MITHCVMYQPREIRTQEIGLHWIFLASTTNTLWGLPFLGLHTLFKQALPVRDHGRKQKSFPGGPARYAESRTVTRDYS